MDKPENPQAFPQAMAMGEKGMTLRDYFAGQALAGICAKGLGERFLNADEARAERAYSIADAMLAERSK